MRFSWILLPTLMVAIALVPRTANAYINAGFKSQAEADAFYNVKAREEAREEAHRLAFLNEAIQRDPKFLFSTEFTPAERHLLEWRNEKSRLAVCRRAELAEGARFAGAIAVPPIRPQAL